jgi:hypothetical protein
MKPVAYISNNGMLFKDLPPDSMLELIPLYTTPSELSNKEIDEVFNFLGKYFDTQEGKQELAKAILKKASEK